MALLKSSDDFGDAVSIIAMSLDDNTYLVVQDINTSECFVPTFKIAGGSVYKQISHDVLEIFGTNVMSDNLIRTYKFWTPNSSCSSMYHYMFEFRVNSEVKKRSRGTTGRYRGRINWITEHELAQTFNSSNLRSPEIYEAFMAATDKTSMPTIFKSDGISASINNFIEVSEMVIITSPFVGPYEQLVDTAGFNSNVQKALYREFLIFCFPALYMGFQTFNKFFLELGWNKDDLPTLFRAGDLQGRKGLSFRELLYLLAALEPGTLPTGGPGEVRTRYVFRFYDRDMDNVLKPDEFRAVFKDMRKAKKMIQDTASINKEAGDIYKIMGVLEGTVVTMQMFLKVIAELKLRGTSTIFRSPISIQKYLKDATARDSKATGFTVERKVFTKTTPSTTVVAGRGLHQSSPKYELAWHYVKILLGSGKLDIENLVGMDMAITHSSLKQPALNVAKKKISIDQFNQLSVTNEVLKCLRYIATENKLKFQGPTVTWGTLDAVAFGTQLLAVCRLAAEIFRAEPRLLHLSPPMYIMGDIHGSFNDILNFERMLWHVGPGLCPCNILFLGDYVDRGPCGVEVMAYLLSYKIQNPDKIRLLRGNHEIRTVQKMFTFHTECCSKFGTKMGNDVWNAINHAFDNMPLAAVIDNSLFCCHGGIPPPWLCPVVTAINDIPVPMGQPDEQSALAWDLMWNDPIRQEAISQAMATELAANEGFAMNKKRGTAHVFNVQALERFLRDNGFTHLIRAHELAATGFQVQHNGKLLTVFSASKYCGGANDSGCILVDQFRLRFLRFNSNE